MSESAEILSELRHLRAEYKALMAIIAPLVTRKESRATQAKKAGCCTTTVWRREKSAERKLRIQGII